jgi:endoglucanase
VRLIARLLTSVFVLLASLPPAGHAAPAPAPVPERPASPAPERVAALAHGVNLTNWFRFPPRADDDALRTYLDDAAIAALRRAGFSFVRLAVQPELLEAVPHRLEVLVQVIRRLQRAGLAVVVGPHPTTWHLEQSAADRSRLLAFWGRVAPALRPLDPRLTYPEILNEPVFAGAPRAWQALQDDALATVRAALPGATVILTGADWGGIDGLVGLRPVADPNVIYSFHFYEPSELTALAAYRPGLDRAALARLPFPMDQAGDNAGEKAEDEAGCRAAADSTADAATRGLITFVCSMRWDAVRVGARIERAAAWGREHHAVLLLGEFGAARALNAPARLAWLDAVRRACEQRGIGWALWGYDDTMGFGIDPRAPVRPASVGSMPVGSKPVGSKPGGSKPGGSTMDRATLSALGLDTAK